MKNVKQIEIDPMKLIPYDKNPRKNEKAIEAVAQSIQDNGFIQPVVIDQHNRICIGHTRTEAAKWIGMKKIPVWQKEMTEAEFIKLNIEDNKTGDLADWDNDLLKDLIVELDGLQGDDVELDLAGFDDLDAFLSNEDPKPKKRNDGTSTNLSEESQDLGNSKKFIFVYPTKDFLIVDQKLDGIMKEHNLESQADALFFALKNFKGNQKTKRITKPKTMTLKKKQTKKKAKKKTSKKKAGKKK